MGYAKGKIATYLFEPWLVNILNSKIKLENVYFVFSIKNSAFLFIRLVSLTMVLFDND